MRAYELHGVNDLRREDIEKPEIPSGWVLVQVKASGICSSDIPRIFTNGTYHFPTIPGHEFSGVVAAYGEGVPEERVGKRVGIFPLIPCRTCPQCRQKKYEMCEHYDYLGSRRDGGFAEYVAVPDWNLMELPENVSFREAAMLEPLSVALHAVKRSGVKPGDTAAVIGTGMIGFAAAAWAKALGAETVFVIGRGEAKRAIAEQIPGISYVMEEESKAIQADVVVEAVGTPQAVSSAVLLARPGGSIVLMGNPSGDLAMEKNVYWRILRKQLNLTGTWNSSYEKDEACDWTEALDALSKKKIPAQALITHCFPSEKLMDGLELMKNHKEPYCKVMVSWELKNMRKSQISASMMCSNLVDLQATIDVFEKEKVEYLHIDVMDGEFVPNFGLGVDYIRGLRELTSIPLDLHLMIKDPEYKLPWIGIHKEDIVTIHYESTFQVQRALDYLVPYGCKRFLAINPATPIGQIEEVLDYIDGVNLLMVNPGFAGQKIVPSTLRKAEKLQKFLQEMHREDIILEVDGNITKEHGATLRSCGASIFVAGTSSIFCTDVSHFGEKIREFRKAVE